MSKIPLLLDVANEFVSIKKFSTPSFVGKGAFKETYVILNAKGEQIALKLADPDKCNIARTKREIDSLLKCNTPLISRLYDYGVFHSNSTGVDYYYSLEEFLDGGTLTDKINSRSLNPPIIREYAYFLIKALDHLKNLQIVHRDIKPDNIMFRSRTVEPVLVDLGIARDLNETSLTPTWVEQGPGTPYFSAPEQLNNEKNLIDWRTDQFSLGVVLSICLIGSHPYQEVGMSPNQVVASVAERKNYTTSFHDKMNELGFIGIPKMVEAWSIRRFQSTSELLKSIER